MHNYGDITNIKGSEVPIVDIVTGGSPCQDLSIAGKRAGLAGERSGLFMEQIRLIKEMRDEYRRTNDDGRNVSPRYMVWENVAGAFSSNKGEDFRAVLEEIAKVADEDAIIPEPPKGKWAYAGLIVGDGPNGPYSICYRLHDAQFFGVPQRRRRLCVLADFNGLTAGKILFELRRETHDSHTKQTVMDTRKESRSEVQPESSCMSGDSESCRTSGEGASEDAEGCSHTSGGAISFQERAGKPGGGKGILIQDERTGALSTLNNQPVCYGATTKGNGDVNCLNSWDVQSKRVFSENGVCGTLNSGTTEGMNIVPSVCLNPWDVQSKHIQPEDGIAESLYSGECRYGGGESYVLQNQQAMAMETFHCTSEVEKVQTLKARDYKDPQVICFEPGAASRVGGHVDEDGIAYSVRANAGDNQQAIVYGICSDGSNSMKSSNPNSGIYEAETSRTLDLNGGNPACNQGGMAVVQGVDCYNLTTTGDVGRTMATAGGGLNEHIPCVVHGVDCYNQSTTGDVSKALTNKATDSDHIPCVVQSAYGLDAYNQSFDDEVAQPLRAAEGGDTTPKVVQVVQGTDLYNGTISGDIAVSLNTNTNATGAGPTVIQVETEVSVRKYPVDTKRLIECIQAHRNMSVSEVAKQLNKPKILVEHWFRKDKCFAIPDADTWMQFKNLLGIETDEFDESIMTFEVKPGKYDMANRIHMGDISPTLMAGSENTLYCLEENSNAVAYNGVAITSPTNAANPQPGDPCHTLTEDSRNYVVLENHPNDSRVKIREDNTFQALTGRMGTGGGNVPLVMENTVVFTQNQRDEVRDLNGIAVGLQAERGTHQQNYIMETYQEPILLESNQNHATVQTDGISTALPASMGMGGGYVPMVVDTYQETTGALCASGYDKLGTQEAMNDMYVVQSSNWDGTQVAPTLTANNANGAQRMPDKDNFNAVVQTYKKKNNAGEYDSGVGTLKACGGDYGGGSETLVTTYQDTTGTICEAISKGTSNQIAEQDQLITNSIVRRLTPKECERLQGFPDDWTNIGEWVDESGKKHKNADSHRYKALGNSIALPFWQWLSDRMVAQLKEDGVENPTMASLFDGIGGFPLVFSRSGCKPMWISEIEDFPIAVTRVRFPNEEVN